MTTDTPLKITEKSRVKRVPKRAAYDRATVDAILRMVWRLHDAGAAACNTGTVGVG